MTTTAPSTYRNLSMPGQSIVKILGSQLSANVSSITYQGPAGNVYIWLGIAQGGVITYQCANVLTVPVPAATVPTTVQVNQSVNLIPLSGAQQPIAGNADGVAIVMQLNNLQERVNGVENWLTYLTTTNAYILQMAGSQITGPSNQSVRTYTDPTGTLSLADFTWRKGTGAPLDGQFLDLLIANDLATAQQKFGLQPSGNYVSIDVSNVLLVNNPDGTVTLQGVHRCPHRIQVSVGSASPTGSEIAGRVMPGSWQIWASGSSCLGANFARKLEIVMLHPC